MPGRESGMQIQEAVLPCRRFRIHKHVIGGIEKGNNQYALNGGQPEADQPSGAHCSSTKGTVVLLI